jgi:hypothetical protein
MGNAVASFPKQVHVLKECTHHMRKYILKVCPCVFGVWIIHANTNFMRTQINTIPASHVVCCACGRVISTLQLDIFETLDSQPS